jgi:peptidoglycan hydrolase-like protein with peptidoglycan-binding domain
MDRCGTRQPQQGPGEIAMAQPTFKKLKRILHKGMRGPDVKEMQERINELMPYLDPVGANQISEDGVFGQSTKDQVWIFQQFVGLEPTGAYDPKTHRAAYDTYVEMLEVFSYQNT